VRAFLDRAVRRLHQLCATLLYRGYPRLTRPPVNLQADELLGAVVERLLKALRAARPASARQFFALGCQHMRWSRLSCSNRSTPTLAGRQNNTRPEARVRLCRWAAIIRMMWPLENASTSTLMLCSRAMKRSAGMATPSGDSPLGQPSRSSSQPGHSFRTSLVD
jgi:hypothetical protein